MNLLERIEAGMKEALKSGDKDRSGTLKMLKSDMMYEKGKTGKDLTDEQMQESVMRQAKKRKESIREYEAAGRKDLSDIEALELKIIEEFLPAQMSFEDVEKAVDKILSAAGEVTQKDFGKIMGMASKELKGVADGAMIKEIVQKRLEGK
jgi:hypothetical protein